MTVGQLLQRARKKKRLTQAQVASQLGKTQPAVQEWESDKGLPRTGDLRKVAKVYGLRPEQLIP